MDDLDTATAVAKAAPLGPSLTKHHSSLSWAWESLGSLPQQDGQLGENSASESQATFDDVSMVTDKMVEKGADPAEQSSGQLEVGHAHELSGSVPGHTDALNTPRELPVSAHTLRTCAYLAPCSPLSPSPLPFQRPRTHTDTHTRVYTSLFLPACQAVKSLARADSLTPPATHATPWIAPARVALRSSKPNGG